MLLKERYKGREDGDENVSSYLKERKRYWKMKEGGLNYSIWRTCFGRGCGPVVRQTT
jgi:hypothetical protein